VSPRVRAVCDLLRQAPLPLRASAPERAQPDSCPQLGVVASPGAGYSSQEVMAEVK